MRLIRLLHTAILLSLLASCGALSSLTGSGDTLDAFTLSPLTFDEVASGRGPHLVVELPTTTGALATDRILIKPTPLQAQYLSDGRWVEPAPVLVQSLIVTTLQNSGHFRLVSRDGAGLMPDYTMMTEVQAFQAEPAAATPGGQTIRVVLLVTLIRESDRSVVDVRRFSTVADAGSDATGLIVAAFEGAMQEMLTKVLTWTAETAR